MNGWVSKRVATTWTTWLVCRYAGVLEGFPVQNRHTRALLPRPTLRRVRLALRLLVRLRDGLDIKAAGLLEVYSLTNWLLLGCRECSGRQLCEGPPMSCGKPPGTLAL